MPSPLIVAVEPDPLQANRVADVLRRAFSADVILADTAREAIDALQGRVPELILASALLPPRDEHELTQWLRDKGASAGHVQTVKIPVLEVPAQAPIFSGGKHAAPSLAAADACDPAMFADWVSVYLDLAATGRQNEITPPESAYASDAVKKVRHWALKCPVPMDAPQLLERLTQHRKLGTAPEFELRWLVEHGSLLHIPTGGFFARKGEEAEYLWVLLSGHLAIHVDRGFGPRRVMEWKSGDVSGTMPYSRMRHVPGDVEAIEPSDLLTVSCRYFADMVRECPTVTTILVHEMVDRARTFNSSERQDEKMVSLGRMAAGLAHELNNPASAVKRTAQMLSALMDQAESATRVLAAARLTDAQLDAIDRVRTVCRAPVDLTPLAGSDREEQLDDWLHAHGADPSLATALMDTGATPERLDELHAALQGDTFETAIRWVAACCAVRTLTAEITTASTRMHELVSAIKRFTYMDQAQTPEPLDLAQGVRDAISMLQHKARGKSVSISLDLPDSLPRVMAIGGDVNQVWTNLLDNALDAVPASGQIQVSATVTAGGVMVRVIDNGPGIPESIREQIFDPFFTTKGVGKGTGLGLEIARRLVLRNNGDIEVDSVPGRTEFRVLLKTAPEAPREPATRPAQS